MDETQDLIEEQAAPEVVDLPRTVVQPYWLITLWLTIVLAAWPVIQRELSGRTAIPATDLAASAALFQQNRYAEAIAAARRYLQRDPNSAEAW
jgi:tetratricopeptide repeat protein